MEAEREPTHRLYDVEPNFVGSFGRAESVVSEGLDLPKEESVDGRAHLSLVAAGDGQGLSAQDELPSSGTGRRRRETIGYRQAEILAELEEVGGMLISKYPWRDIRNNSDITVEVANYKTAGSSLIDNGLISVSNKRDSYKVAVTDKGAVKIDQLKKKPELIQDPPNQRLGPTAAVLLKTVLDLSSSINCRDGWAFPVETKIYERLSEITGLSEDALSRRIYQLVNSKKYFEIQKSEPDESGPGSGTEYISNIRLTPIGQEIADELLQLDEANSPLGPPLDETEVEDAEILADNCIILATELGDQELANSIQDRLQAKSLFELSQADFDGIRNELSAAFFVLTQRKIAEGKKRAA